MKLSSRIKKVKKLENKRIHEYNKENKRKVLKV